MQNRQAGAGEKRGQRRPARPRASRASISTRYCRAPTSPPPTSRCREAQKKPAAARETFFLQAGAFQNAPDADNLKARLALLGVEATIQTTTLPDKGVWHRVRVGPYTSVEELNRTRDTLKQNGVETALIKVRE